MRLRSAPDRTGNAIEKMTEKSESKSMDDVLASIRRIVTGGRGEKDLRTSTTAQKKVDAAEPDELGKIVALRPVDVSGEESAPIEPLVDIPSVPEASEPSVIADDVEPDPESDEVLPLNGVLHADALGPLEPLMLTTGLIRDDEDDEIPLSLVPEDEVVSDQTTLVPAMDTIEGEPVEEPIETMDEPVAMEQPEAMEYASEVEPTEAELDDDPIDPLPETAGDVVPEASEEMIAASDDDVAALEEEIAVDPEESTGEPLMPAPSLDQASLEEMIRNVVRDELMNGDIGQNISENVVRLIQEEVRQALTRTGT